MQALDLGSFLFYMRHFNFKLTREQEINLCELYLNTNITTKELSKLYGISTNIIKIIKRNNYPSRKPGKRLYNFNENYFETIDTFDKAYFLGLIVSDGNVFKNYLKLSLQERDEYILKKLIKHIKYTGNLYNRKRKNPNNNHQNQKMFEICSDKIVKDLLKYGIIPNKSHFTYFPDIPEEFHSHFIRGVFDGDGCIHINKKNTRTVTICGNKNLILAIQKILMKECSLKQTKCDIREDWFYTLKYGGNKQVERIGNYLYKDCEDLYLTRKKEKFKKYT